MKKRATVSPCSATPVMVIIWMLLLMLPAHYSLAQPTFFQQGMLDLKSLTDSSGTVHLFYRQGVDEESFNIRHYDTETEIDSVLLADRVVANVGRIIDYTFFDNDPTKVIYFGKEFIRRYDETGGFEGDRSSYSINGLHIPVQSPQSEIMYATTESVIFIKSHSKQRGDEKVQYRPGRQALTGFERGKKWPDPDSLNLGYVPDSTVLDFPFLSQSPFHNDVMFGWSSISAVNTGYSKLYRSTDGGETREVVWDSLDASQRDLVFYDADSTHVYLWGKCPEISDSCSQALYKSADFGAKESWEFVNGFKGPANLIAHPERPGELYLKKSSSILISAGHGDTFTQIYQSDAEEITSFTVEGNRVFFTTPTKLFQLEDGVRTRLIDTSVGTIDEHDEIPSQVTLHQNYPNPFNPSTTIAFQLNRPLQVSLVIYDTMGREVDRLLSSERFSSGRHQVVWNAEGLASGIYLVRARFGDKIQTRKITLVK